MTAELDDGGQPGLRDVHVGVDGSAQGCAIPHRAVVRTVRNTNYITLGPSNTIAQTRIPVRRRDVRDLGRVAQRRPPG
jgi:hypothetical protein